eukprot:g9544.t1
MASNVVANAQTNDTQKKSPVKRLSIKDRQVKIAKMREQKKVLKKKMLLDEDNEELETDFFKLNKEIQKEKKILGTQEKNFRENILANVSILSHHGIYDNKKELVVGVILNWENAKAKGFTFESENEFSQFRAWYYELYKNVSQTEQPDVLLKAFKAEQGELGKEFNGDKWVQKEEAEEA